jgi:hypothetical protein
VRQLKHLCQDDTAALDWLDWATAGRHGGDHTSQESKIDNVILARAPDGNANTYALRKLRKDRPDLHEPVAEHGGDHKSGGYQDNNIMLKPDRGKDGGDNNVMSSLDRGNDERKVDNVNFKTEGGTSESYALRKRAEWVRRQVRDLLNEPVGGHGNGPGRGNKRDDNIISLSSQGTSESYAIGRLKRDWPDLAEVAN